METIHLKTADPVSQHLLRSAAQRGLQLVWERYEQLQPQDGFLRLGLSCPFECLHGPCRIDPFGRGPAKGICGLGRDEMVAAMVLRLCQKGAIQALAALPGCNLDAEITCSDSLGKLLEQAQSAGTQPPLSSSEIVTTSTMLQRPAGSCETLLRQALRLSMLTLALVEQGADQSTADVVVFKSGYGVIPEGNIRIGFCGTPSADLVNTIERAARQGSEHVVLVALGDWLRLDDGFMPLAATTGEAELLLSSGAIHLLVGGPDTDPSILNLCHQLNIPVVMDGDGIDANEIVKRARTNVGQTSSSDIFADIPAGNRGEVILSSETFAQKIDGTSPAQVALVGGSDSPHLPLGQLPAELAAGLAESGIQIAGWGDAALWMARQDGIPSGSSPLVLENRQGPLLAVKGLADAGRLEGLRGICFTGMKDCVEFSQALGLASIGCRVSLCGPIPVHGSRLVMDTLARMLAENDGELLYFDQPPSSSALSEWFTKPQR